MLKRIMSKVRPNNPDAPSDPVEKPHPEADATETAWHVAKYLGREDEGLFYRQRYIYQDDVVNVMVEQGILHTVLVRVIIDGEMVPVLDSHVTSHNRKYRGPAYRYNPGMWESHLQSMRERAMSLHDQEEESKRVQRELDQDERYRPIDDASVFQTLARE